MPTVRSKYLPDYSVVRRVGVGIALLIALLLTTHRVVRAPWDEWTDSRMAMAAALSRGYDIYSPTQAAQLGNIYAPGFALFYSPAGALSSTPSGAIRLGSVLGALITTLPVLWLFTLGSKLGFDEKFAAFAAFWLLAHHSRMLPVAGISADAPSLGFAVLACGFVLSRVTSRSTSWREWLLPAICVVCAVASKQLMVMLPVAIAGYLGVALDWRAAGAFLMTTAVAAVGALLAIAWFVDIDIMLFRRSRSRAVNRGAARAVSRRLLERSAIWHHVFSLRCWSWVPSE